MNQVRTFSFGGGVQSTACLVLAARGELDFRTFVFVNVGEDSENPNTLAYIEQHAKPYAAAHGIEFVELRKHTYGRPETLLAYLLRRKRQIVLPARLPSGAACNRTCTYLFKIRVIASFQFKRGANRKRPAANGLGISTDEAHRCRTHSPVPWQVLEYPLIDLGLDRDACRAIIADAGLPEPDKSSCWFCPFHRVEQWRALSRQDRSRFATALFVEGELNLRRADRGQDEVYLSTARRPLGQIEGGEQPAEAGADFDFCESGHCMT